jgi:hypothetical protein
MSLRDYFTNNILTTESRGLNRWMLDSEDLSNSALYINGRFQGLFPGLSAKKGYGGHPGLIYKLLICAVCYNIKIVGITISARENVFETSEPFIETSTSTNPPSKKTAKPPKPVDLSNPLSYTDKYELMMLIIEKLKRDISRTLTQYVQEERIGEIDGRNATDEINRRISELDIDINPLAGPIRDAAQLSVKLNPDLPKTLIMISGLEKKKEVEVNKYASTFNTIIGSDKPFQDVKFILTSRSSIDTQSGTQIRKLMESSNYGELARYLVNAGFLDPELIQKYGEIIPKFKRGLQRTLSSDDAEYPDKLLREMKTAATEKLDTHELTPDESSTLTAFVASDKRGGKKSRKRKRKSKRKSKKRKSYRLRI